MSVSSYKALTENISSYMKKLGGGIPEVLQSFGAMNHAANKNGALDHKTKEMMALAIAVAIRCDGCIGFHVKALVALGITREEIMELLSVAIYMGGGPSVMYATNALAAFEEFSE